MMKLTLILLTLCVASCVVPGSTSHQRTAREKQADWSSFLRQKRQRYDHDGNAARVARTPAGRMANQHYKRELSQEGTELAELPLTEVTGTKEPHIEKIWSKLLEMFTSFRNAMKEIRQSISETTKRVMRHVMNK